MKNHKDKFVGENLYSYWLTMKESDFEGRIERDGRAVRVCDFKVSACEKFVDNFVSENKNEGMLIWFYHNEMGRWIYERLQHNGHNVLYCPAGKQADEEIQKPENRNKITVEMAVRNRMFRVL